MGGDFSFVKGSASWQRYRSTPLGGVLAMRLMVGGGPHPSARARGWVRTAVPYDDRFFAGGASSVRGYRHNSLGPQVSDQDELDALNYGSDVLLPDNPARGGNYLMLSNLEWRFPLPVLRRWNLGGTLFFEGGNVWERLEDIRMLGFRLDSDPGDPTDPGSTKVWDYRYSYGVGPAPGDALRAGARGHGHPPEAGPLRGTGEGGDGSGSGLAFFPGVSLLMRWVRPARLPILVAWVVILGLVLWVVLNPALLAPHISGLVGKHLLGIREGGPAE